MTNRFIIIACGITLITTPAAASSSSAAGQKSKATSGANADTKKYCIAYDKVVGSRVDRVVCKTKSEWAQEHVDVDRLIKDGSN